MKRLISLLLALLLAVPALAESAPHVTPTPVPTRPFDPSAMRLYYNPDGGTKYHVDPSCPAVSARYLPMAGSFAYGQLNEAAYRELVPCVFCGAPARPESTPHVTPTPVPAPQTDPQSAEALSTVDAFFYFWRVAGEENLLSLTAPSWRAAQANPQAALSAICAGWTPAAPAELLSISGTADDPIRTVRAKVSMQAAGFANTYVFNVIVLKEDGHWYVDPQSVALAPAPSPTPAAPAIPVYVDGVLTSGYVRETPINMPGADAYLPADYAVTTWRGSSFRQNAAASLLEETPAALEAVWACAIPGSWHPAFTEDIQPVIIKWPQDVRMMMNLTDAAKATSALKEVILPGMDGQIRFLNLADGSATRAAIDIGYPMNSSVTLHPLGYPLLLAGQAYPLLAMSNGHIGLRYIEAVTGHVVRFVDGNAAFPAMLRESRSGAFTTAALIDKNTNTAVFLSKDGWLFTESLGLQMIANQDRQLIHFGFDRPQSVAALVSSYEITAAPVMHGSLLWLGNAFGQIICIDTTTMQPLWTQSGLHGVSALAMRETAEGTQLLAISGMGAARLTCLDPATGAVLADIPLTLRTAGPCAASAPVVGRKSLEGLVFVNLSGPCDATAGLAELCAINLEDGQIVWRAAHPDPTAIVDAVAAPVAVYDEAGNGYLITAMEGDTDTLLLLTDGQTGDLLSTLTLEGAMPCNPAAYGDMLVITTHTEEGSIIHGIRLAPEAMTDEALVSAFLTAWAANDRDAMLSLSAPSWRNAQQDDDKSLFMHCANRTPTDWTLEACDEGFQVRVLLDWNTGRDPVWHTGTITLAEENGQKWIDPGFLASLVRAE